MIFILKWQCGDCAQISIRWTYMGRTEEMLASSPEPRWDNCDLPKGPCMEGLSLLISEWGNPGIPNIPGAACIVLVTEYTCNQSQQNLCINSRVTFLPVLFFKDMWPGQILPDSFKISMTEKESFYKQQPLQNTALTTVNRQSLGLPITVAQKAANSSETTLELYSLYLFWLFIWMPQPWNLLFWP